MTAGTLFNRKRPLVDAGGVAGAWRELADHVDGWPHAESCTKADQERRIVFVWSVDQIRVVHPDGLDVHRAMVAKLTRDRRAERRQVVVAEVVRAVHGDEHAQADRVTAPLIQHVVLPEELDGLVAARAENSDLQPAHRRKAILEADD